MINKILVGVDGSESAQRALEFGVEFAGKWNARLVILTVIPTVVLPMYIRTRSVMVELDKALGETYMRFLTEASQKVKDDHPEIIFVTRLEKGRPPDVIVEVGLEEDVDLIVIGSRGNGGISTLLGGTSRQVVETWIKPIIIVR